MDTLVRDAICRALTTRKMFYFARHAEAESNISEVRLGREAHLTDNGRRQSQELAEYCVRLNPDMLFSSPVYRTMETALPISRTCNIPIKPLRLLNERRRPSEVNGKHKHSSEVVRVDRALRENFHLPHWRYSDEENFDELKERCLTILAFLDEQDAKSIVAVTHGILIRVIVACAIHGDDITGEACERFIRGCRMEKSGVTAISVNHNLFEEGISSKYQLWTWNDYSHVKGNGNESPVAREIPASHNRSPRRAAGDT